MRIPARAGLNCCLVVASVLSASMAGIVPGRAEDQKEPKATGKSFVENFDKLDKKRWYVSDGWSNGDHQNCTWSAKQVNVSDGILKLGFQAEPSKGRSNVCGEVQTNKRFSYGTFEVRMKAAVGSGLNTGFFSFIGPVHKQPHDEIDFEVLGKDPSKVQVNQYVNGKSVGSAKLVDVPGGADKEFHDYAFVWQQDRIAWYVDGKLVEEATDPAKLQPSCQDLSQPLGQRHAEILDGHLLQPSAADHRRGGSCRLHSPRRRLPVSGIDRLQAEQEHAVSAVFHPRPVALRHPGRFQGIVASADGGQPPVRRDLCFKIAATILRNRPS
jgi:endo-1,3-1,4-beta-glycanase ExoK